MEPSENTQDNGINETTETTNGDTVALVETTPPHPAHAVLDEMETMLTTLGSYATSVIAPLVQKVRDVL
jgi:hypothetical protein